MKILVDRQHRLGGELMDVVDEDENYYYVVEKVAVFKPLARVMGERDLVNHRLKIIDAPIDCF